MIICENCQKSTTNPKFCSRSCAVAFNNRKHPKRKKLLENPNNKCLFCNGDLLNGYAYCSQQCSASAQQLARKEQILEYLKANGEYPTNCSTATLKRIVVELNGDLCSICGIHEWNGKPLVKILDHIDGNSTNMKPENLRLVCSNCDSQLDTYKSRNRGSGRHARRERYHKKQSY